MTKEDFLSKFPNAEFDEGINNPLISHIISKLGKLKKSKHKKFLHGLYLNFFTQTNKSHNYEFNLFQEIKNSPKEDQFIGFFGDELQKVNLNHITKKLKKIHPDIQKVQIRLEHNNTIDRYITWRKIYSYKKIGSYIESHETNYDFEELPIDTISQNGFSYLEVIIGEQIFGGKTLSSIKPLSEKSLLVREDQSYLPPVYKKNWKGNQFGVITSYDKEHNHKRMLLEYLNKCQYLPIELDGLGRKEFRKIIKYLKHDSQVIERIEEIYRNNKNENLKLEDSLGIAQLLPRK
jgi:hypothetical protein